MLHRSTFNAQEYIQCTGLVTFTQSGFQHIVVAEIITCTFNDMTISITVKALAGVNDRVCFLVWYVEAT